MATQGKPCSGLGWKHVLKDYFEALERLKRGKPVNVPKGGQDQQ